MCSLPRYSKAASGLAIPAYGLFQGVTLQQQLDALARKELVLVRSVCDMVCSLCCIVMKKNRFVLVYDTVAGNL